jgi:hypothetical protein
MSTWQFTLSSHVRSRSLPTRRRVRWLALMSTGVDRKKRKRNGIVLEDMEASLSKDRQDLEEAKANGEGNNKEALEGNSKEDGEVRCREDGEGKMITLLKDKTQDSSSKADGEDSNSREDGDKTIKAGDSFRFGHIIIIQI